MNFDIKKDSRGGYQKLKRYIALLRGINVSGKNKISMAELKKEFEDLGHVDVVTYLNSGNVIFSSEGGNKEVLSDKIRSMIFEKFGLDIPILVILQEDLKEILNHIPDWWGDDNKEIYDNLIFMMSPLSYEEFYDVVGDPKIEYEKVYNYNDVIFWSFVRDKYQNTNWWSRTASSGITNRITIRTAKTVRKIAGM